MSGHPLRIAILGNRWISVRYSGFSTLVERLPPVGRRSSNSTAKHSDSGCNATKPKPGNDGNNGRNESRRAVGEARRQETIDMRNGHSRRHRLLMTRLKLNSAQMTKFVAKRMNAKLFEPFIVRDVSKNWRHVDAEQLGRHREFIKNNYIHPAHYWETKGGEQDLKGLTIDRLHGDRRTYIPWISSFLPLRESSILEVGAGTGSSTVALAEQGARVTGIDILEEGVAVAKDKCRLFGVEANLIVENFLEYTPEGDQRFDAVIFFASLEHMLPEERLQALPRAWEMIRPGGYLIIIEAPNRLWYDDWHTSLLPFFNWLPRELALQYMQFSPRAELVDLLTPPSEVNLIELQRWGLGVSFHEFDLALGKDIRNSVSLSLQTFLRRRSPFRYVAWHVSGHAKFARFLKKSASDVPNPWFEAALDIAIQRP